MFSIPPRPSLTQLLLDAAERLRAMTPAERDAMHQAQRESWARSCVTDTPSKSSAGRALDDALGHKSFAPKPAAGPSQAELARIAARDNALGRAISRMAP